MPKAAFERLNNDLAERGERLFMNPRKCRRRLVRQKNPSITDRGAWMSGCTSSGGRRSHPSSHWETLHWLKEMGFRINPRIVRHESLERVQQYYRQWADRRHELEYEIDGLVVKIDPFEYQQRLGVVGLEPRWAIATSSLPSRPPRSYTGSTSTSGERAVSTPSPYWSRYAWAESWSSRPLSTTRRTSGAKTSAWATL
jgi:DNA ligase (NAD+)